MKFVTTFWSHYIFPVFRLYHIVKTCFCLTYLITICKKKVNTNAEYVKNINSKLQLSLQLKSLKRT